MKKVWKVNAKYFERTIRKKERRKFRKVRNKKKQYSEAEWQRIVAPEEFTLTDEDTRYRLLKFVKKMREVVYLHGQPLILDFRATKKVFSGGALLFKAELCRLLKNKSYLTKIKCLPPRNLKVYEVLGQIGVYELLGFKSKIVPSHPDVVNWRYANGNEVNGEKYNEILGSYDGMIPDALANGLYMGITEAMTNCHHHAYMDIRDDNMKVTDVSKDWWMFSQEKDGQLSVVFCDLGVGIPKTLPYRKPDWWSRITGRLGFSPTDGDVIREAIKESRTRTGLSHRGKGLKQLVEAIENFSESGLIIHSNKGSYVYKNGRSKVFNYKDSILGTLIMWTVPIEVERKVS